MTADRPCAAAASGCGHTQARLPVVPLPRSRPIPASTGGADTRDGHVASDGPVDPTAVAEDDQLIEDLRADCIPPTPDQITRLLAAWRADVLRST